VSVAAEPRHLPYPAPIEAYGKGGFRFAGMSHRGSLLCLPDGIWPWPIDDAAQITEAALEPVFTRSDVIDLLLIGAGRGGWAAPAALRQRLRAHAISVEVTNTGSAVSTYNILLGEGRRVAAGLIAHE
jgi:uncharacterized protein